MNAIFILLWCAAILQWVSFIYLPAVILYGITRMIVQTDIIATICSPFFGIKKVSLKSGFIIWMIQAAIFGAILYEICQWIRLGVNPLILMW